MLFPQPLFKFLILTALMLMSIGAISLVGMLLHDLKANKLW